MRCDAWLRTGDYGRRSVRVHRVHPKLPHRSGRFLFLRKGSRGLCATTTCCGRRNVGRLVPQQPPGPTLCAVVRPVGRSDGQYYPKGADYAQGLEQCGMGVAGCTRSSRSARRSDCCRALAGRLRRERCVQLPHLVRHRRRPHCAGHGRARLSPTHGSSSAAVSADPPPPDRARPLHRPRHQPDLTTRRAVSQLSRVTIGFSHSNRTVL